MGGGVEFGVRWPQFSTLEKRGVVLTQIYFYFILFFIYLAFVLFSVYDAFLCVCVCDSFVQLHVFVS